LVIKTRCGGADLLVGAVAAYGEDFGGDSMYLGVCVVVRGGEDVARASVEHVGCDTGVDVVEDLKEPALDGRSFFGLGVGKGAIEGGVGLFVGN
jgi:hypothetical protein